MGDGNGEAHAEAQRPRRGTDMAPRIDADHRWGARECGMRSGEWGAEVNHELHGLHESELGTTTEHTEREEARGNAEFGVRNAECGRTPN